MSSKLIRHATSGDPILPRLGRPLDRRVERRRRWQVCTTPESGCLAVCDTGANSPGNGFASIIKDHACRRGSLSRRRRAERWQGAPRELSAPAAASAKANTIFRCGSSTPRLLASNWSVVLRRDDVFNIPRRTIGHSDRPDNGGAAMLWECCRMDTASFRPGGATAQAEG